MSTSSETPDPEPIPLQDVPRPARPPLGQAPFTIPVEREATPYKLAVPIEDSDDQDLGRPEHRRIFAQLLIGVSVALSLGATLRTPTQLAANDISRWCTVWSLLEHGTYNIDDCPWQANTQDKVKKPDKLSDPSATPVSSTKGMLGDLDHRLKEVEYRIAPRSWKVGDSTDHFYSSKPPLLPTIIAGILYPVRHAVGVPLHKNVDVPRTPRNVQKPVEGSPGKTEFVLETPKEPTHWAVYVLYFKPIIILLNVVPMLVFLILYARLLDRTADNDWAWFLSLFAASLGNFLIVFNQTLNNHTIAAWSAFFTLYALQRITSGDSRSLGTFALAGFFGAFTACNELPAAIFGILLFLLLLARWPGKTLRAFVPAAAIPCIAFLATQYAAFGQFKPVYEEFGTKSYTYEGSYWNTPLEMDWFSSVTKQPDGTVTENQEPYGVYLFHMTLGHHGVFSLTPIFLFSLLGALREAFRRSRLTAISWLTLLLTVAMIGFYTWNPKARNYGGSTQGLRWLFWLIPFWLITLPSGVRGGGRRGFVRALSLAALLVSAMSVGYAIRHPWSHPWILDAMERLNLYELKR